MDEPTDDGAGEPPPVGAAEHHVQGDGGDALVDEVAVEDVGEVGADVAGASSLRAAPGVVRASLELWQEVGLRPGEVFFLLETCAC